MSLFTKDIQSMDDLFVHQLLDIYDAENPILQALPRMISMACDPQLRQALEDHMEETRIHVSRLEQVFRMHGTERKGVDCPAIDGIMEEADEISGEIADDAIIASAQAVEHYAMPRYGTLVAWATELGCSDCARVLSGTREEKKTADRKLTSIAESRVNQHAA